MSKIDSEILKWCIMYVANLTPEQLDQLIKEKMSIFGHLLSEQTILGIIASELGISLPTKIEEIGIKLNQLIPGLYNLSLKLSVKEVEEIKTFTRPDGTTGQLVRVKVCDKTGEMWLVLWDEQTSYAYNLKPGMKILVSKARTTTDGLGRVELQLDKMGTIKILEEKQNASV
ncbi:MAG TPA: hypothetical protein ENG66_05970 [Thermococcus sp.]|nr:hypothetical protein [Thermococcus sp.]